MPVCVIVSPGQTGKDIIQKCTTTLMRRLKSMPSQDVILLAGKVADVVAPEWAKFWSWKPFSAKLLNTVSTLPQLASVSASQCLTYALNEIRKLDLDQCEYPFHVILVTSEKLLNRISTKMLEDYQETLLKYNIRFSIISSFQPEDNFIPFRHENSKCDICDQEFNLEKIGTIIQQKHFKTASHQIGLKKRKLRFPNEVLPKRRKLNEPESFGKPWTELAEISGGGISLLSTTLPPHAFDTTMTKCLDEINFILKFRYLCIGEHVGRISLDPEPTMVNSFRKDYPYPLPLCRAISVVSFVPQAEKRLIPIISRHVLTPAVPKRKNKEPSSSALHSDLVLFLSDILQNQDKKAIVELNSPDHLCSVRGCVYPVDVQSGTQLRLDIFHPAFNRYRKGKEVQPVNELIMCTPDALLITKRFDKIMQHVEREEFEPVQQMLNQLVQIARNYHIDEFETWIEQQVQSIRIQTRREFHEFLSIPKRKP